MYLFPRYIERQKRSVVSIIFDEGKFREKVVQVIERFMAVYLGSFYDAVQRCARVGAGWTSMKQIILSTDHKWTNGILNQIIIDGNKSAECVNIVVVIFDITYATSFFASLRISAEGATYFLVSRLPHRDGCFFFASAMTSFRFAKIA